MTKQILQWIPNSKFRFLSSLVNTFRLIWGNKKARVGLLIVVFYILMGTVGPLVTPPPRTNPSTVLQPPSLRFPLGTDQVGESMLSLIVYGTPFVLEISFLTALFSTVIALVIGLIAGYSGGLADSILMGSTDVIITIPSFILILILASYVRSSNPIVLSGILSVTSWGYLARATRSQVLAIRNSPYLERAKLFGLRWYSIVFMELLPALMPYIVIHFIFNIQGATLASVGLYFLGVLPYNGANWGVILNNAEAIGATFSLRYAYMIVIPSVLIVAFVAALFLLTYGMDEVFNPRLRR